MWGVESSLEALLHQMIVYLYTSTVKFYFKPAPIRYTAHQSIIRNILIHSQYTVYHLHDKCGGQTVVSRPMSSPEDFRVDFLMKRLWGARMHPTTSRLDD